MTYKVSKTECAHPVCPKTVPDHYWGRVKASGDGIHGWFFSAETGEAFCPDHLPDWVVPWRESQRAKKSKA